MKKTLSSVWAGVVLCAVLVGVSASAATISRHEQTVSGLLGWRVQDENIKIELNPLQKDQVRAFYLGRGFSQRLSERIVDACVYQTVIENISDAGSTMQIEVNLSDWRTRSATHEMALRAKDEWIQAWAESGASESAILAFKWATFPTRQFFKLTGDFGWGMILFGMPAGASFDLRLKWYTDDMPVEQWVQGLSCPD